MGFACTVLADSVSRAGFRLTTLLATFPRIILAEVNTHRDFSRCSASSRAIPVEERIRALEKDMFVPREFAKNKRGMQSTEVLEGEDDVIARDIWIKAGENAIKAADALAKVKVHKALANRVIEPFCWHTAVITATEWENHDSLRAHPDAQSEYQIWAKLAVEAREKSKPTQMEYGHWHMPFVDPNDVELAEADPCWYRKSSGPRLLPYVRGENGELIDARMVSSARVARVSVKLFDGRTSPVEDGKLAWKLRGAGHMSPFEHVAKPADATDIKHWKSDKIGNFRGWVQLRKEFKNEHNFGLMMKESLG